jgi:CRISPR system Cascade subunit CasA
MNLTGDPWLPVVFGNGASKLVSLDDAFARGHEILDLVATPPQRIALTRLLVCIAQAALDGPENEEDWATCREQIAPAALAYLDRHRASFELFGDEAFLQVPNLEEKPRQPLDKLDFGTAFNTSTLFDHGAVPGGRPHLPEWAALMLVTYQCFSPSGLIGVSRWNRVWTSKDRKKKDQDGSESAPCLVGSPLHVILRGEDLLSTIHMNLLTRDVIQALPNTEWGRPSWEIMPEGPDDAVVQELGGSYLGRLVPMPRAVKLGQGANRITLANGLTYPKIGESREPCAIVVLRNKGTKQEPGYLRVDPLKHPWRELSSILALAAPQHTGGPLTLSHIRHLQQQDTFDVWTGGLAMDPHPGKAAKFLDAAEWSFSLPAALLGSTALHTYQEGVICANRGSQRLRNAITVYFEDLAVGEFKRGESVGFNRNDNKSRERRSKVWAAATAWYWSQLDANYKLLVDTAADPRCSLGGWYGTVRNTITDAYNRACPHGTPRQLRAFAKGAQRLKAVGT